MNWNDPEQRRAYFRNYRQRNKKKVYAQQKKWRKKNREHVNEQKRVWRKKNHKKCLATEYAWRERNHERVRRNWRKWARKNWQRTKLMQLKSRFGLTPEQYAELKRTQKNRCAICGARPNRKRKNLDVDHDHKKEKVRGLLCHHCNPGLGLFKDNPKLLRAAALYLKYGLNWKEQRKVGK